MTLWWRWDRHKNLQSRRPKKKNRSQSHQTKEIAPPPSIRGKRRRVIGCTVEMSFDRFFLDWIHLDPTELSSVALDRISRAYWVFTGFYLSLRRWTSISLGFSWVFHWGNFYWVLLGFTGFYCVLSSFTGCYWNLVGFTGFYLVLLDFYWVLLGLIGFYWVLLGFTVFYWV